jgi:hypothetical protein
MVADVQDARSIRIVGACTSGKARCGVHSTESDASQADCVKFFNCKAKILGWKAPFPRQICAECNQSVLLHQVVSPKTSCYTHLSFPNWN